MFTVCFLLQYGNSGGPLVNLVSVQFLSFEFCHHCEKLFYVSSRAQQWDFLDQYRNWGQKWLISDILDLFNKPADIPFT